MKGSCPECEFDFTTPEMEAGETLVCRECQLTLQVRGAEGNTRGVRIGSRLKPALLEAFLSPETLDGVDVEEVTDRIRESAPHDKHVWDLATLDELVRAHRREQQALSLIHI